MNRRHLLSFGALAASALALVAGRVHAQEFALTWHKFSSGGTMQATGGVYTLQATLGQVDAGRVAASNVFRLETGYQAIALQQLGYPTLHVSAMGTNLTLQWFTIEPGFVVQQSSTLGQPQSWTDLLPPALTNGVTNTVTVPLPVGLNQSFYRLRRP